MMIKEVITLLLFLLFSFIFYNLINTMASVVSSWFALAHMKAAGTFFFILISMFVSVEGSYELLHRNIGTVS